MLTGLDRKMSLFAINWAFPIMFLIHDTEEIITLEQFVREHHDYIPEQLVAFAQTTTTGQFFISVMFLFALCILAAYFATRTPRFDMGVQFFNLCLALLLANVFTHIGQTILMRGYTPGIITAMLVILPYSLYTFRRIIQAGLLKRDRFGQMLIGGFVLVVPLILVVLAFGKWVGATLGI